MTTSDKFLFSSPIEDASLNGTTLIMPAISIGNIGQLAIDILIATLKAKRLTSCHHPSLVPLVGSDPLDTKSTDLMTACDMYTVNQASAGCLILMQIRSAIAKNRNNEFLDDLLSWCNKVGVAKGKLIANAKNLLEFFRNI